MIVSSVQIPQSKAKQGKASKSQIITITITHCTPQSRVYLPTIYYTGLIFASNIESNPNLTLKPRFKMPSLSLLSSSKRTSTTFTLLPRSNSSSTSQSQASHRPCRRTTSSTSSSSSHKSFNTPALQSPSTKTNDEKSVKTGLLLALGVGGAIILG